jgi:hypothetical protein
MRQVSHIFRKDVRHLWPEVSMALAAVAGFTYIAARQAQTLSDSQASQGIAPPLLTMLVPLVWWGLIARLIYGEPLAGDQPFWVTRPYARRNLIAAKAFFILVFVNLPKFVADVFILHAYGFPLSQQLGGLIWTQVILTTVFVLPAIALCTVTAGFAQLIATVFLLALTVTGWNMIAPYMGAGVDWLAFEWVRADCVGALIALAALAIIVRQYWYRDTVRSRLLAGGATLSVFVVLLLLPWRLAFSIQSRVTSTPIDSSAIRIEFDPTISWAARTPLCRDKNVEIEVPLRITGIPAGMKVAPEGLLAAIESPGGDVWRTGGQPRGHIRSTGDISSLYASIDSASYDRLKNQPVRIRGSVFLTLYGNPRRAVLPIRDQPVFSPTPGVGLCSALRTGRGVLLSCRSAFRSRPDLVTFDIIGPQRFVLGAPPMSFLGDASGDQNSGA